MVTGRIRMALGILGTALAMRIPAAGEIPAPEIPADVARIINRGVIVVAMTREDAEPFFWVDPAGNLVGLDVDLAADIASNLGVRVEFARTAATFDALVDMVATRQADIAVSCLSRTPKRSLKVLFSQPYLCLHQALILNRLKTARLATGGRARAWLNAPEIRLGTVRGSSYVDFAQRYYPKAGLSQYDDFPQAAADVVAGRLHAVIYDDSMILDWSRSHPAEALYVEAKVMKETEDPICIAIYWEDRHLQSWLNDYLNSVESEGLLPELREKYLGEEHRLLERRTP